MTEQYRLELETPSNGRVGKTTVHVLGADDRIVFSDHFDLRSSKDRDAAGDNLVAAVPDADPTQLRQQLKLLWYEGINRRREMQQQAESGAPEAATQPAEDVDAEAERLLETMSPDVRAEAVDALRSPDLLARIVRDIEALGVAGEREVTATLYLVGTSRKLDRPQSARVKGPTASGKSYLVEQVASLFPPEAVILATKLTPESLFHMRPGSLKHRWIVAGERSRKEDDAAAEATRGLRELISSGRLSKLMPVKIGNVLETKLIRQDGPVAYVETTSLDSIFAEDENRCLSLYTDERKEQTRRIIDRIASDAAAGPDVSPEQIICRHHAIQRRLRRREIVVPYAVRLGKLIPDRRVEARRGFPHLLGMIRASALLHQFQREIDDRGRVVASRDDYCVAQRLLQEPMRRLLGGGAGAPARRFYERLRGWFGEQTFTSREATAREETSRAAVYGWLGELHRHGALDQVEAPRGRNPATWKVVPGGLDDAASLVLPSDKEVFDK
jgi:hypothetical protein